MRGLLLALLGIAAFAVFAILVEDHLGIPFKTTFRIACVIACLILVAKVGTDYPGQSWPKVALVAALLFDIGLFFTPLGHLPASRGDLLLFGAPDAAILLTARAVSYRATDEHQRAVRQQLIVGSILALAFCAILLSIMLIPPRPAR